MEIFNLCRAYIVYKEANDGYEVEEHLSGSEGIKVYSLSNSDKSKLWDLVEKFVRKNHEIEAGLNTNGDKEYSTQNIQDYNDIAMRKMEDYFEEYIIDND